MPTRKSILRKKMKGGNAGHLVMHPTFSPQIAAMNPQSYLPYNDFSNDPNYSVVDSRLTSPVLSRGGSKKKNIRRGSSKKKKNSRGGSKSRKMNGGFNLAASLGSGLYSTAGQVATPGLISDVGGVAQTAGKLAGIDAAYNSSQKPFVPLA